MTKLAEQLVEEAGSLARAEGGDLRAAAVALLELSERDETVLHEAQQRWAQALHENPEDGDALGALVLLGAALHLQREQKAQER
jgi:hypothetical protein